jgi:hypothetical protein
MIWVLVIIVVRQIIFEQKKAVRLFEKKKKPIFYNIYLVPLIQPEIVQLSTNQPCQIDIYLKVKKNLFNLFYINSLFNKGFGFN